MGSASLEVARIISPAVLNRTICPCASRTSVVEKPEARSVNIISAVTALEVAATAREGEVGPPQPAIARAHARRIVVPGLLITTPVDRIRVP